MEQRRDPACPRGWVHWSAPRRALLAVGGFRTAYGRTGGGADGGEEIVAAALIRRLGLAVVVDPTAGVLHRPEPARFTLGHVWRRIQAAKREELAQERTGYIPRTLTRATVAWRSLRRLRHAAARGPVPSATRRALTLGMRRTMHRPQRGP